MAKQKFSFDDTIEYDKEELNAHLDTYQGDVIKKEEFAFDDTSDKTGDQLMKKKKKKKLKLKLKKWHIALIALIAIGIVFVVYIFVASNQDGPVYGDRCAQLIEVDDSQFSAIEETIEANDNIQDVAISMDCRTIKMTFQFVDNIASQDAMNLATDALHQFDDSLGQSKEEGMVWSELLNAHDGRLQYDVDMILKSTGDTNFPVFATKHATVDNITFTGANVKDQATTDKVNQAQSAE